MSSCRHASLPVDGSVRIPSDDDMKEDTARIGFRVRGAYLAQLRDVQDVMGFNTPTETIQYLAQRGLEAMSGSLAIKRTFKKLEGLANPQEMLPLLRLMGVSFEGDPTTKEIDKV